MSAALYLRVIVTTDRTGTGCRSNAVHAGLFLLTGTAASWSAGLTAAAAAAVAAVFRDVASGACCVDRVV